MCILLLIDYCILNNLTQTNLIVKSMSRAKDWRFSSFVFQHAAPILGKFLSILKKLVSKQAHLIWGRAWKKGQTYGTILVDLELRRPIELLPDRSASTSEAWLRRHPEVEIVSRDRGGDYAAAAKKGAPRLSRLPIDSTSWCAA